MTDKTPKEYELTYASKKREEDILADTMSVPFQPVKQFGNVGENKWHNKLIFGDNLQALKHLLKLKEEGKLRNPDGKDGVRLVYIDPPFASKQDFEGSQGQKAYQDKIAGAEFLEFLRKRLVLLRELLTSDGSIYVHLDWRKAHYVKILMDEIFGESHFLNEIIWCYSEREMHVDHYNRKHDVLLFYESPHSNDRIFNSREIALPYSEGTIEKYTLEDEDGGKYQIRGKGGPYAGKQQLNPEVEKEHPEWTYRDYLDEKPGIAPRDWFDDIPFANRAANERVNFPTQKPEKLLDRIIRASSNSEDIVLDAFAGSGTLGAVAEKLDRKWIMIDSSKLAIYTMQKRMLNLKEEIGQKGESLEPEPFTLYNSGIYEDGEFMEKMKTKEYEKFVLELFQAEQKHHELNGLEMQGLLNSRPVLVFSRDKLLTHDFIDELHNVVEDALKDEMYIIVPQNRVRFNEDYIIKGEKKYIVLRIPYSIIEEIKNKGFERIEQPHSQDEINKTIDSVGFDFIYPPKVECEYYKEEPKETLDEENLVIEIRNFEPVQITKNPVDFDDPMEEALAMVMIDKDYNDEYFEMDEYFFGDEIVENDFKVDFPNKNVAEKLMIIYLDVLGNEKREVKALSDFE